MSIADGRQNRAENAPFMATPSYLDKIIYARDKICLNLKATRPPRPEHGRGGRKHTGSGGSAYSTVTLFARLRGLSGSRPSITAVR